MDGAGAVDGDTDLTDTFADDAWQVETSAPSRARYRAAMSFQVVPVELLRTRHLIVGDPIAMDSLEMAPRGTSLLPRQALLSR
jgi:hypothetical protein